MWRNWQWHFAGMSGVRMVDFRLKSYLRLVGVSYWPPSTSPIVECHIVCQWDVSKERETALALRNHTYIRQLVQELMKWYFQVSVGFTVYYSLTWARQIVFAVFRKYANLYLCRPNISKAYTFIIVFFPISYRSLSAECLWFPLLF